LHLSHLGEHLRLVHHRTREAIVFDA